MFEPWKYPIPTEYGYTLFDYLCNINNAYNAYYKSSSQGRRFSQEEFILFEMDLYNNLDRILYELYTGIYEVGNYTTFIVHEPKERIIQKLSVRDRVVQHMWNTIIEPLFERYYYYYSFACRKNKGTHMASYYLHNWLYSNIIIQKKRIFCLKCDIKSYFKTIDHTILKNIISKYIIDKPVFDLTCKLIDKSDNIPTEKGIPIGNLSSQNFANIYLTPFDNFVKNILQVPYYIRYMDDFLILHEDYDKLIEYYQKIVLYLQNNLSLQLHDKICITYCNNTYIDFIGYRHFPTHTIARKNTYKKINNTNIDINYNSYSSRVGYISHIDSKKYLENKDIILYYKGGK